VPRAASVRSPYLSGMRLVTLLVLLSALVAVPGCRETPPPLARPTTLAAHPRAMDRLARLMRDEFIASDPAPIEQRIRCEHVRVERALGTDFRTRLRWLQDSLRREFSSEQHNQLGQRLAHLPGSAGYDPMCRAFDQEARREAPLDGDSTTDGQDTLRRP
jgi:hypothetical protein